MTVKHRIAIPVVAAMTVAAAVATASFMDDPDVHGGTRFGSMDSDTVLYTKAQADAVFAVPELIPTKVSELDNDAGYLTEVQFDGYAKTNDIPTKVSELDNDAGYLTEVQFDGYAKTNDIPTKVSELDNDAGYLAEHQSLAGYAKMEADYEEGSLTITSRGPGDDGLFLKVFSKDGCPAIAAGSGDVSTFEETYVYSGPTVDMITNDLWNAVRQTYTKDEVVCLVAHAIYSVSGPFALVEDEHGNPAVVRRTEEELQRMAREFVAVHVPGGYPGNAYVNVDDGDASVYLIPDGAVATNYPGNAYLNVEGGTNVLYRMNTNERVGIVHTAPQE